MKFQFKQRHLNLLACVFSFNWRMTVMSESKFYIYIYIFFNFIFCRFKSRQSKEKEAWPKKRCNFSMVSLVDVGRIERFGGILKEKLIKYIL